MARSFPPLKALRTFESAVRLGSFTKAAAELHVTPGAVSHQIRGLERHLGVQLFRRTGNTIVVTEAGATAAQALREGFDQISQAVQCMRDDESGGTLTVSVTPAFATRWLVSRLMRFQAAHAAIRLRLLANPAPVDFDQEDVDVAVRIGHGSFGDVEATPMFPECVAPVAAPALLRRLRLRRPSDLKRAPLLHDDSMRRAGRAHGWLEWQKLAGMRTGGDPGGAHYDDGNLALQAAATGAGVALGRLVLAFDDLAGGRLRIVTPPIQNLDLKYYLLVPRSRVAMPAVVAFKEWIVTEAASFRREFQRCIEAD